MAEITEQFAPFTPIDTSRFGIDADKRREDIALSAYYRAEVRGFAPGGDMGDWLETERKIATQGGGDSWRT